jgi:hypothetical protein
MNTVFKVGDKVKRTGCDHGNVKNGHIYTISKCVNNHWSIKLCEVNGTYDTRMFKSVDVDPEWVHGSFVNPLQKMFKDLNVNEQLSLVKTTLNGHLLDFKGQVEHEWRTICKLTPQGGLDVFHPHAIMRVNIGRVLRRVELTEKKDKLIEQLKKVESELEKLDV